MTQSRTNVWRAGATVWIAGSVADNRPHRHHALQVAWASPGAELVLETATGALAGTCVVVAGDVSHSLEMPDGLIALVDPASPLARQISVERLAEAEYAAVASRWSGAVADASDALAALAPLMDPSPIDPRVQRILGWLDEMEARGQWGDVTLDEALARAALSRGRFLHLFSEAIGAPWRAYLVWRRALVAIELAAQGASLTAAAHTAGYSDSAHLSRQFVSLFGVPPSSFVKDAVFDL